MSVVIAGRFCCYSVIDAIRYLKMRDKANLFPFLYEHVCEGP